MRAIIVHWSSAYGSVRGLMDMYAASFRLQGIDVFEVDIAGTGWEPVLIQALEPTDVRFALITSGIGLELEAGGRNLWEQQQVPVFSLQFDLPVYRQVGHVTKPANFIHGYFFRDHARFQQAYVKADNLVTSLHCGVPDIPITGPARGERPRVVFPKTGGAPGELENAWRELPKIGRLLFDLMDAVGLGNCASFVPAAIEVAAAHGMEIQPFDKLARFLVAQADDYVRRRKSTMVAEALTGFEVDVFGKLWEHVTEKGTGRARFHGGVPFPTVEAAMASAGATISTNPNVDLSAHDRFFLAVGAGKVPLSDRNRFSQEECPLLEPYLFDYSPESVTAAFEAFFARPSEAAERARETRAAMRMKFPVEASTQHIIECVRLVHYLEYAFRPPQNFYVAG